MKEQPNNWLAVYETPHEFFPEISYDDFYEFHIANWMLPAHTSASSGLRISRQRRSLNITIAIARQRKTRSRNYSLHMNLSCVITRQYTNFHQIHRGTTMRNRTQEIRTAELIRDISNHPNRDELIKLMHEQLKEDTLVAN